jgi:copper resistance protein D
MSQEVLVATAIRWVGLAGLATLVGALLVEALLLPRDAPGSAGAAVRLRRLGVVCLTVLVATTAGELVARARTMAGGDLAGAIAAIPVVLARTHFGAVWIARFVLLGAAFLVIARATRPARIAALGLGLGLTVTTSLTGHGADGGDLTWTAGIDWVHVLAVSAWTGGLLALALVVLGDAAAWPPARLGALMRRFSRLAGYCLVAALVSGGYNAWVQIPSVSALWTTFYGRVLTVKLVLVLGVIGLGAVNRYAIVARLGRRRVSGIGERLFRIARLVLRATPRVARAGLPARLRVGVRREAVLVVAVFAVTAVLVDSTPARHAEHASHRGATARGPFRVTMEELHESGGVPRGWVLTPPPGDVTRGKEVFARLGCHACHRVGGEPAGPARLGPDLSGVGEHHPAAYILESILNPDAVIVQARGYTTPEGRSIMPDYRGQLSVGELIDLVAYVQSL